MKKVDNKEKTKLTVDEVADIMDCTPQFIRVALQQGLFEFGVAVKTSSNRYTYYINAHQFYTYMGMEDRVNVAG